MKPAFTLRSRVVLVVVNFSALALLAAALFLEFEFLAMLGAFNSNVVSLLPSLGPKVKGALLFLLVIIPIIVMNFALYFVLEKNKKNDVKTKI